MVLIQIFEFAVEFVKTFFKMRKTQTNLKILSYKTELSQNHTRHFFFKHFTSLFR